MLAGIIFVAAIILIAAIVLVFAMWPRKRICPNLYPKRSPQMIRRYPDGQIWDERGRLK